MKIIIERIWSGNPFLPKASIVKSNIGGYYRADLPKNTFDDKLRSGKLYTYRLRLRLVKNIRIK